MEIHTALFQHSMSGAADGRMEFCIDRESKMVSVTMQTVAGEALLSSIHLRGLALLLESKHGIIIYDRDSETSYQPTLTDWRCIAMLGAQAYRVRIWQQLANQWCVDIYPVAAAV